MLFVAVFAIALKPGLKLAPFTCAPLSLIRSLVRIFLNPFPPNGVDF